MLLFYGKNKDLTMLGYVGIKSVDIFFILPFFGQSRLKILLEGAREETLVIFN